MTAKSTSRRKSLEKVLRTKKHGEVFTRDQEINLMLDLVPSEVARFDSRFLESACGDGNFLEVIVLRRLEQIRLRGPQNTLQLERDLFSSISSVYGIELLEDNVIRCRERLNKICREFLEQNNTGIQQHRLRKSIEYVISLNIVHGDALTLKKAPENVSPIVFSEWSFVTTNLIKRRDFIFSDLVEYEQITSEGLFSDLGERVYIPTPIAEYQLTDFLELGNE
jgi:hypothetical protein